MSSDIQRLTDRIRAIIVDILWNSEGNKLNIAQLGSMIRLRANEEFQELTKRTHMKLTNILQEFDEVTVNQSIVSLRNGFRSRETGIKRDEESIPINKNTSYQSPQIQSPTTNSSEHKKSDALPPKANILYYPLSDSLPNIHLCAIVPDAPDDKESVLKSLLSYNNDHHIDNLEIFVDAINQNAEVPDALVSYFSYSSNCISELSKSISEDTSIESNLETLRSLAPLFKCMYSMGQSSCGTFYLQTKFDSNMIQKYKSYFEKRERFVWKNIINISKSYRPTPERGNVIFVINLHEKINGVLELYEEINILLPAISYKVTSINPGTLRDPYIEVVIRLEAICDYIHI